SSILTVASSIFTTRGYSSMPSGYTERMATTIEELSDSEKMALFQRMVQAGAISAGVRSGDFRQAMTAVEVAGTVTLDDLAEDRICVAAAAHQLVDYYFPTAEGERVPQPSWLRS